MTKKEKLEYFKLIEPKLREKFLSNGKMLPDKDFEAFNIKGNDIKLFKEKYSDFWEQQDFTFRMRGDGDDFGDMIKECEDLLDSEDEGEYLFLKFPEDKYFFQLGIPKLDIFKLKVHLHTCTRILFINRSTGDMMNEIRYLEKFPVFQEKQNQEYLRLVIDDPYVFLKQLENGEIDKILSNDRKFPRYLALPETHPFFKSIKTLNLENLVSVLSDERKWILYNDWYYIENDIYYFQKFKTFEDFSELKEFEVEMLKKYIDLGFIFEGALFSFDENRFFFKVENPSKMKSELLKGNTEVINEIKKITYSSIFLPSILEG